MSEAAQPPEVGRFITLEGGEGAGKSTQARHLADWLAGRGVRSIQTREPGGSKGAEAIRALLVTGEPGRWDPVTEALLVNAARRDHVLRTIRPALAEGYWVICDRFLHSTLVYQGLAGGVAPDVLNSLIDTAVEGTRPDLTIVLDIDPAVGMERADDRAGTETRFERKGMAFHKSVADGFRRLAAQDPNRCAVVDAVQAEERVAADVIRCVSERLDLN